MQATGPIEDLAQTWLAARFQGAMLASVQLVQDYVVTAAGGQGNDNAWRGRGDPRIGHS